jgi:hypothetical protein
VRKQYSLSKPIYAKRAEAIAKIPTFWPLVIEQSPLEVDQFIQPNDSRIFVESLESIEVSRHELDNDPTNGSARSFTLKFNFKPNDDFEETVLVKKFDYRRARDGATGLVSEPVKITWKKGKDLTEGLTDGAVALWDARKKKGDMTAKDIPEYDDLAKKVEHWNGSNTSFFTFFGWVSTRRWVSAEESAKATEEWSARQAARKRGEKVDAPQEEEEDQDDENVEVHEAGEDLAISFADDIWPNAIKFFTLSQEIDQEMSDLEFEENDDEDDDDEEGEAVDIRALVGKGRKRDSDIGPSSKKQKK